MRSFTRAASQWALFSAPRAPSSQRWPLAATAAVAPTLTQRAAAYATPCQAPPMALPPVPPPPPTASFHVKPLRATARGQFCPVCQANVPSNPVDWDHHVRGKEHGFRVWKAYLLQRGDIVEPPPDVTLKSRHVWCRLCDHQVGISGTEDDAQWKTHLLGAAHRKAFGRAAAEAALVAASATRLQQTRSPTAGPTAASSPAPPTQAPAAAPATATLPPSPPSLPPRPGAPPPRR